MPVKKFLPGDRMDEQFHVLPMKTHTISIEEYEKLLATVWPLNDLMKEHGQVFKVRTPPKYQLKEAKNFKISRYYGKKIEDFSLVNYYREDFEAGDGYAYVSCTSSHTFRPKVATEPLITRMRSVPPLELAEPFTVEALDNIVAAAGNARDVPYIRNLQYESQGQTNKDRFLDPSSANSPIKLLHSLGHLKEPWHFKGPAGSSTFLHLDDFALCTLNTCLHGYKLWFVIHPDDTDKALEKLRIVGGNKKNCPQSFGDKKFLIPLSTLIAWGLRVYVTVQSKHDTIILGGNLLHQCVNLSFCATRCVAFIDAARCNYKYIMCTCKEHDNGHVFDGEKVLSEWISLRQRQLRQRTTMAGALKCPLCPMSYNETRTLNQHVTRKHRAKQYVCPKGCNRAFGTKAGLRHHMKRLHTGTPLRCDHPCRYSTKIKENLIKHRRGCKIISEEGFTFVQKDACAWCGKSFVIRLRLNQHLRICKKVGL